MRVVIKIGSSTLSHKSGRINIKLVEELCKIISDVKNAGHEIILVSSGAVAMGVGKLNLDERPKDMASKQAVAAVGQSELMHVYDKLFSQYHHVIGQVLITDDDLSDKQRSKNFDNTLNRLLELKVLPIINENDTVATAELENREGGNAIGDNDTLSVIVAVHTKADMLILLSDIDGLYTADPNKDKNATLIERITEITPEILGLAGTSAGTQGTGGMITKIRAAKVALENNIEMIIANGKDPHNIYDIIDGKSVGTRFKKEG